MNRHGLDPAVILLEYFTKMPWQRGRMGTDTAAKAAKDVVDELQALRALRIAAVDVTNVPGEEPPNQEDHACGCGIDHGPDTRCDDELEAQRDADAAASEVRS